jgi:hypothetical protein
MDRSCLVHSLLRVGFQYTVDAKSYIRLLRSYLQQSVDAGTELKFNEQTQLITAYVKRFSKTKDTA